MFRPPIVGWDTRSFNVMDQDRKDGLKHEVKGTAKEVAGKVTGNKLREAEGKVEKNLGKIQNAAGKAADDARDQVKKNSR